MSRRTTSRRRVSIGRAGAAFGAGLLALVLAGTSSAGTETSSSATAGAAADTAPKTRDHFQATTTGMTPAGLLLRVDLLRYSDMAGRQAVVAALSSGGADGQKALAELPTLGYVWAGDGGVGYSVKYAYRAPTPQGQRVTLVTDQRLGAYDFKPWAVKGAAAKPAASAGADPAYSVIELYLDGQGKGDGTLSLAAGVKLDKDNAVVDLARDGAAHLLTNAVLEPKPYTAKGD
jgi:hypothetical protein